MPPAVQPSTDNVASVLAQRGVVTPELQIMVDVTRANTEQLVQTNLLLEAIRANTEFTRRYFEGKDGFEKELQQQFAQNVSWLWLKMVGAQSLVTAVIVALAALLGGDHPSK
jgi:hypothetical protein